VIGKGACRGAATIVNAIATGKGAAFGITLEADAIVELERGKGDILLQGSDEGHDLVSSCVRAVASKALGSSDVNGEVHVRSDIPISRGLKSSSAVSNAVVLAAARASGANLSDMEIVLTGIEESIRAGVTITGAFDDASACFFGGVAVTDNLHFISTSFAYKCSHKAAIIVRDGFSVQFNDDIILMQTGSVGTHALAHLVKTHAMGGRHLQVFSNFRAEIADADTKHRAVDRAPVKTSFED
jgi:shikimate kinase